jgi:NAD(P)-dependent dehydrogenase (short-subunit alcohol dehydrogenase family)
MQLSSANHAFITGGASGIGLGIADALLKRGVRVTIADINADAIAEVLRARGNGLRSVLLDVRDRDQWQLAKAKAEEVFGPVDVLVNNAGIAPDGLELADSNPESFERIVGINFYGVYNGILIFGAGIRALGKGHIVNVASMAGLSSERATSGAYSASKYAVVSLSETLRVEMAPHGVGVSVMCPGLVMTNLPANTARVSGKEPRGVMPGGLDPAVAGEMAVRGIERGSFYILTSFDRDEPIRKRFEEQLAAFAAGMDPDLA